MKYLFLVILFMSFQSHAKLVTCESEETTARGRAKYTIAIQDQETENAPTVMTLKSAQKASSNLTHKCTLKRIMKGDDTTKFYLCQNSNGKAGFWFSKDSEMSWANYYGDITLNGMSCIENE